MKMRRGVAMLAAEGIASEIAIFDVTDQPVLNGVARIEHVHGPLEIPVNEAGIKRRAPLEVFEAATGLTDALVKDPEPSAWLCKRTPAGRWGRVEDLAGAAVVLASAAFDFRQRPYPPCRRRHDQRRLTTNPGRTIAMPTLLQIASVHPDVQPRLTAGYTLLTIKLEAIDDAWLALNGPKVDGIITGGHLGVPAALMTTLPNLKVVAINGVGYDKVDLTLARSRGVRVSNTPDVLTDDVADLAVGLTLSLLRRIPHGHAHVGAGRWPHAEMPLATKLSGKRVGILGLGRIGRAVAKRFGGFTEAIAYADVAEQDVPYKFYPEAVSLAAASDVLVVCAAASASTRGMIGDAVLDALGPDGYLVNVARGSVVDEPALVEALRAKRIAGAALDVFADEPNVPISLLAMDHVVLTPHIASGTHETRRSMGELVLANLDAFLRWTRDAERTHVAPGAASNQPQLRYWASRPPVQTSPSRSRPNSPDSRLPSPNLV